MDTKTGYDQGQKLRNDLSTTGVTWGGNALTKTVPTTLTTSELPIYLVTYSGDTQQSQLMAFLSVAAGGTAGTFNYYVSPDNGVTWYPIVVYTTSTGVATQRSYILNSTAYTLSSVYYGSDAQPMPTTTQLLVTGLISGSTAAFTCTLMGRNN